MKRTSHRKRKIKMKTGRIAPCNPASLIKQALSGDFCKFCAASGAGDHDFPLSLWNPEPFFAAGTFEETVILPVPSALLPGGKPAAHGAEKPKQNFIFRCTPGNIPGKEAKHTKSKANEKYNINRDGPGVKSHPGEDDGKNQ
jgi:hypothetical protein